MVTRLRDHLGVKVFPVHRLDRPTSGCLLFALSPEATRRCQLALEQAEKTYLALVRGHAASLPARIDRPLRPPDKVDEVPASTSFEVLARWDDPRCALVAAHPHTGRFHQVRRHLAGAGSPVLLDSSHGDSRIAAFWRARGLARLFLHCARLELPLDGGVVAESPLPADLQQVIDGLGVSL